MMTTEKLAKFVGTIPAASSTKTVRDDQPSTRGGIGASPETLISYLAEHGVTVKQQKNGRDGSVVLVLDGCPMNSGHGNQTDTAVIWRSNSIGFECKHNGCVSYTWSDLRQKLDPHPSPHQGSGSGQSTKLVQLACHAELFHDADNRAYATIRERGHAETYLVRSKQFRYWLSRQFYLAEKKAPNSQALQDAITTMEGIAVHDGPEYGVFLRLAEHGDAIYLDLGDKEWRCVEITHGGWNVIDNPPVKFIRPKGLRPLSLPVKGGKIAELKKFINTSDENSWILIVSWLVGALKPCGPYPILVVNGEQGSAKSTACRLLRDLIDPNDAPLRSQPRNEHDLAVAASNAWIVNFDNLSVVPDWLSDAMCRLSTGGGFSTRQLYSDDEEVILKPVRPMILNGIEELGTRADLLDRVIRVVLPPIPRSRRRDERRFWKEFNKAKPRIIGALLDVLVESLRNRESTKIRNAPRMADFAEWVLAGERKLPWKVGEFLQAFASNEAAAHELAIEASPIGPVLQRLLSKSSFWSGTATELLILLRDEARDRELENRSWPKQPNVLSGMLRRIAPNLRHEGIEIMSGRNGHERGRSITIRKVWKKTVRIARDRKRTRVRPPPNPKVMDGP